MPPQPHFESAPRELHDDEVLERDAVNDEEYGPQDVPPVTIESLYAKRRAHEKHLALSYRDPKIDQDALAHINEEIGKYGGNEEGYLAYLKEVRESE
jgi:hypothetical protein